jgi:hypothetical protein
MKFCKFSNPFAFTFKCTALLVVAVATMAVRDCDQRKPNPDVVNATGQIATYKEQALVAVSRVKTTLKSDSGEYNKARQLYDAAMAENNCWISVLKLGVQGGQDLGKSAEFKTKASAAAKATKEFTNYCSNTVGPTTKALPLVATEIAKLLVENGLAVWKAVHEQRKQDRIDEGNRIDKELRWPKWEDIK